MLLVLLKILQIIGIILLCLLGLLLLILLIVLFVPIRYRFRADRPSEGNLQARVDISFLLRIVHLFGIFEEGELQVRLKILGITFRKYSKGSDADEENDELTDNKTTSESTSTFDASGRPSEEDYQVDWNEEELESGNAFSSEEVSITEESSKICEKRSTANKTVNETAKDSIRENADSSDNNKKSLKEKLSSFLSSLTRVIIELPEKLLDYIDKFLSLFNKADDQVDKIVLKVEKLEKKYRYYERLFNDSRNKKAFGKLKNAVKKLIKYIRPKRIRGHLYYGFGPEYADITGMILSYIALMLPFMPRRFGVQPDFEEFVFDMNIDMKGRFTIFSIIRLGLSLFFDKDVKRLYRIIKNKK